MRSWCEVGKWTTCGDVYGEDEAEGPSFEGPNDEENNCDAVFEANM